MAFLDHILKFLYHFWIQRYEPRSLVVAFMDMPISSLQCLYLVSLLLFLHTSVRFKVARLLNRPILLVTQLNDRIVIGRSINQTFRPSIKATTTFEKFSEAYISGFRNSRRILEYGPKTPCHELKYIFYTCF